MAPRSCLGHDVNISLYLLSRVDMLTPTSPLTHMERMKTARAVNTRKKAGVLRN